MWTPLALVALAIANPSPSPWAQGVRFELPPLRPQAGPPLLRFRQGRLPPPWSGRCVRPPQAEEVYSSTVHTVEGLTLRSTLACQVGGQGPERLLVEAASEAQGAGLVPGWRFDGGQPRVRRTLMALPAGHHLLRLEFRLTWDEHVDGGTYEGRSELVAQGLLPLDILP